MNSTEIFNHGRKTWRPGSIDLSTPLIHVVANSRVNNKISRKANYKLKIHDVAMTGKSKFSYIPITVTKRAHALSRHLLNGSVSKSDFKMTHQVAEVQNMIEIRHIPDLRKEQMEGATLRIIKKERTLARKVSLKWSKYSTSSRVSSDTGFSGSSVMAEHVFGSRDRYLQMKYFTLWRCFIRQRRTEVGERIKLKDKPECGMQIDCRKVGKAKVKTSESATTRNLEKLKLEAQQQKINEQANLIKELQLARIKLEEELFAKETEEMRKHNESRAKLKKETPLMALKGPESDPRPTPAMMKDPSNRFKENWQSVMRMEIRAQERKQRWDSIRERKLLLEAERMEKLRFEAERKRQLEEEEKKRKILLVKEQRKKQEELKRKQEEERLHLRHLNDIAVQHYHQLLAKSTLRSFALFLQQRRLLLKEAETHYKEKCTLRIFINWKLFWKIEVQKRNERADEFYETCLLRNSIQRFKEIHLVYTEKIEKAKNFHIIYVTRNHFYRWLKFSFEQKCKTLEKEDIAYQYYEMLLMRRYFEKWKHLPMALFQNREKEHKLRLWCNRVKEFLPDFEPSYELS